MEWRGHKILLTFLITVNLIYSTDCEEEKKVIIYVPSRVKTVHHHHHHVIYTEKGPHKNAKVQAKPCPDKLMIQKYLKSSQEYQKQSIPTATNPITYVTNNKLLKYKRHDPTNDVAIYPSRQLPFVPVSSYGQMNNYPSRSKIITRIYYG
ncbi:uncharacterized protein LOC126906412 [Daktulosphaira vitifoliae]|uniref:uncharacterized protein LOC126906412 n=1 Tax=Daktulosphaira vitifoliae TaxID=58002 RepID=UPI0021A9C0BD|nr:uncharacterized protein LOC126906412 [Daktulosphaira vitifoliae]